MSLLNDNDWRLDIERKALMNYRNKKVSAYISINCRGYKTVSESYEDRFLYSSDTTANYISEGIRDFRNNNLGIRSGMDWYISKNDVICSSET